MRFDLAEALAQWPVPEKWGKRPFQDPGPAIRLGVKERQ